VSVNLRLALAQHIRRVDGGNNLIPFQLGTEIEAFLGGFALDQMSVARFVERINPAKTVGAALLADEIVDKFDLDEE
jgi:hypothetical protein